MAGRMETIYRTYVEGTLHYSGASLEDAARAWDANTYRLGQSVAGGIAVATYEHRTDANGESYMLQLRDGWILHVHDDGTVYVSPHILDGAA